MFLDPPFDAGLWDQSVALLDAGGWLAADALVYAEAGKDNTLEVPGHWRLHRRREAGAVRGTLYRVAAA